MKWFDQRHGIGVICAEGQRWDYLVLRCAVGDAGLAAGERVSFEPVNKALGCWAFNVIRRG